MEKHGGTREGAGRPVSDSTLRAQEAREFISAQVKESLGAIVNKAITQAIEGNAEARSWLSDRGWGKPAINLGVDDKGQPLEGCDILVRK